MERKKHKSKIETDTLQGYPGVNLVYLYREFILDSLNLGKVIINEIAKDGIQLGAPLDLAADS